MLDPKAPDHPVPMMNAFGRYSVLLLVVERFQASRGSVQRIRQWSCHPSTASANSGYVSAWPYLAISMHRDMA